MSAAAPRPHKGANGVRLAGFALLVGSLVSLFPARGEAFEKLHVEAHAKVGIVSILTPEVTNRGGGMTIFSQYKARLSNDWQLDKFCVEKTKSLLEADGYHVVDLALDDASLAAIAAGEDASRLNHDGLTRDWKAKYQDILSKNGLAAVVVLRDNPWPMQDVRGNRIDHGFVIGASSGVNTTKQLETTLIADAIGDIPPHRAVLGCFGREKFDPGIIPVKLKDATIADLAPFRARFEALLEKKLKFDLWSAGLLSEMVYCPSPPSAKNTSPGTMESR
jgi:hypothetical protein